MATISFELPDNVQRHLACMNADVDGAAKEAAVVEMYRQGQISHGALAECLGLSRYETDAVLKRHHVTEDMPSLEEFEADLAAVRRMIQR
jgi:predicted HTH domain antitoxin